jgi:hypothetical protein
LGAGACNALKSWTESRADSVLRCQLDWIPGESQITGSQATDPLVLATSNALRGLQLRLTLNADGEYTGLANQDQVASQVQNATDLIVRGLMEKLPAEQRATVQKLTRAGAVAGSASREHHA